MDLSRFRTSRFGCSDNPHASSGCSLLRAIAGCPAGLRETRRGSFLVLVVGTLALMSVFAIVYIAIGRADLGTSSGVKRHAERDDVPDQFAEYVAGVIADDATAMYVDGRDGLDGTGKPIYRREDTDYPSTSWEVTSIRNSTSNRTLDFRPTGTSLSSEYNSYDNVAASVYAQRDRHLPSDPWLASLTPTWLNYDGLAPTDANRQYLDFKDWAQISNVAPDGAFVNLTNLRGNFAAPAQAMRVGLNLIEDDGTADTDTDFGDPMRTVNVSLLGKSYTVASHPSDVTMRQRGAFRLATDINFNPGDPRFALNQWADADGDGFLDARWFELTDARDPVRPKGLLKTNGKHRYFFATRIVDLSGLINVTTATDTVGTPTKDAPIGATPADVDLRRLLTMQDFRDQFNSVAYDAIPQTANQKDASNYAQYDVDGTMIGAKGYEALYGTGYSASTANPPAGRGAAISGLIPAKPIAGGGTANEFYFGSSNFWKFGDPYATFVASAVKDRGSVYRRLAANAMGVSQYDVTSGSVTSLADGLLVSILGSPDLEDLLTYRGLNNPEISSNLELIFDGRYLGGGISLNSRDRYGPFRSNRGTDVERETLDVVTPFGVADPAAMLLSAASVRQYVTTVSGSRPIRSTRLNILPETNASNIANNTKVANTLTTGELKVKISTDAPSLYKGYAAALIPDAHPTNAALGLTDTWPATAGGDVAYNKFKHLNYGGTTPELGAVMSAHLAANMAAALASQDDTGSGLVTKDPVPFSVILAEDQRATKLATAATTWAFADRLLDLGADKLPSAETQVLSPLMNVYGIVPEPVVSALGVFHLYTSRSSRTPTINGDIAVTNGDFVGQVLAFQVTNPFGEKIAGSAAGTHYIEFGGRSFGIDVSSMDPGETKTFYVQYPGNVRPIPADWFKAQFEVDGVAPVEIKETTRLGGGGTTPTADLVDNATPGSSAPPTHPPSFETVRLWRVLKDKNGTPYNVEKDQLVDRFRVPFDAAQKGAALADKWNRMPGGANAINVIDDGITEYEGLSITLATAYRRPQDPNPAITKLELGAPAFMLERKFKDISLNRQHAAIGGTGAVTLLDPAAFEDSLFGAGSLDDLFLKQSAEPVFEAAQQWLTNLPKAWADYPIDTDLSAQNNGAKYDLVRTEILRWSSLPKETKVLDVVRAGDMLMPLAVGPEFVPSDVANPVGEEFEKQYTILGEALAMAMGYDAAATGGATKAERNTALLLTDKFGGNPDTGTDPGTNAEALVDRGHLRLDAFTSFYDGNSNNTFESATDLRRGTGVPIAFNVLNVFTPYDAQLDRAVPGIVNLNTAPLPVLRTLPMLSPPNNASLPTGVPWWFAAGGHDATSDIAASVVAYRDKSIVNPRNGGSQVKFNGTKLPTDYRDLDGRGGTVNGIDGVREFPGFASVGELMAIRGPVATDPNNIDYLSYKTAVTVPDDGVRSGDTTKDMKKPYADKLLVANAVSNTAAVRSDVFAVWFVVAGFAKTDLVRGDGTPLLPPDPMVPSVQRRFVMVVDRSNVTQKGQKPRIVLFKEVPL